VRKGVRSRYGPDPAQFGELYRPREPAHPGVVVVVHGGVWRARYDLALGRPLAADLAAHGFTAWNVEYRRVGNGGGWPVTADDVGAAIDHLATLDVDTSGVVTIGHSAGGHLAVWVTGRATPLVPVTAAVAQAGVLDVRRALRNGLGGGAVAAFLGGPPDEVPDHYRAADLLAAAPPPVPVLCVHARADDVVPIRQSEAYVAAAGNQAILREQPGDHFTVIDPQHGSWALVRDALPDLLAGRLPQRA
jgi:acetyl esterase/lipase